MTTNTFSMFPESSAQNRLGREDESDNEQEERIHDRASLAFLNVRWRAVFGQLTGLVTGGRNMPMLSERLSGKVVFGQLAGKLGPVEIKRIVGSESRIKDFDADFNPLHDHIQDRWQCIAELTLKKIVLPAVDLIQVGGQYFVRDGHHRVSVARALGLGYIDARVTVLEI